MYSLIEIFIINCTNASINRERKKKINLINFNREKNNNLHETPRDFIRSPHPRWIPSTTVIRILSRDSIPPLVPPRFPPPPPPSTFTADASKNEGRFLASRARRSLNPPNSRRIFVPFPTRLPPQLRRHRSRTTIVPSFHVYYRFLCGPMRANDSSFYSSSSYTFYPQLYNSSYTLARISSYDNKYILLLYTLLYSFHRYISSQEIRNSLILFIRISYLYILEEGTNGLFSVVIFVVSTSCWKVAWFAVGKNRCGTAQGQEECFARTAHLSPLRTLCL